MHSMETSIKPVQNLPGVCLLKIFKNLPTGELHRNIPQVCPLFKDLAAVAMEQLKSLYVCTNGCNRVGIPFFNVDLDLVFKPDVVVAIPDDCANPNFTKGFTHMQLFTEEDIENFVRTFPAITSLTINFSRRKDIDRTPLIKLIQAYPELTELRCIGFVHLVDTLKMLPNLKHLTHIEHSGAQLDRIYMEKVPEVMQRLESLMLDEWVDAGDLPKQLIRFRFWKCPKAVYMKTENLLKCTAIRERITKENTYEEAFDRIVHMKNLKLLGIELREAFHFESFFVTLFSMIRHLPNLEKLDLIPFCDLLDKPKLGDEVDPEEIEKFINELAENSPFQNIKAVEIPGFGDPFGAERFQRIFPNAIIRYGSCIWKNPPIPVRPL